MPRFSDRIKHMRYHKAHIYYSNSFGTYRTYRSLFSWTGNRCVDSIIELYVIDKLFGKDVLMLANVPAAQGKNTLKRRRIMSDLRYDLKHNKILLLMVFPSILYLFVLSYLPMVGIYYAFTNYNYQGGLFGSPFVGFANFRFLFASGTAWKLTFNTVFYNLIFIFGGTALRIAIAIMLSEIIGNIFRKVTQTIIFLPHFVSMVLVGVFAYNLMNYETGLINNIITSLGGERFDFYGTPWIWRLIIPAVEFWKSTGYGTIIYLAAILGISEEIYEAAIIDGVTFMQKIRYITLPSLKPTFTILLLMSLGGIIRGQFDLFYQLIGNNGLLFGTTDIIDTYVYRVLRVSPNIGMGSAVGLYQSVIGALMVLGSNYLIRKLEPENALF